MGSSNLVNVHTSLPPCIDKPESYFYLHLHLNYVKWISKSFKNYEDMLFRVQWWGEEGIGATFIPRCVNLAGYKQNVRTHAIYPIRVPMNHFTTYLLDMGKLQIDAIEKSKSNVLGRAYVPHLEQLTCNNEVQCLSDIVDDHKVKIGEIMVALSLEKAVKINDEPVRFNPSDKIEKSKGEAINAKRNENRLINSDESLNKSVIHESEKKESQTDFLDKLIAKGKKLRDTIAINVKQDDINKTILQRSFPSIENGNYTSENDWIKNAFNDQNSSLLLSGNDLSKIHTESILKTSAANAESMKDGIMKPVSLINNDIEALKLIASNDSFLSGSDSELSDKQQIFSSKRSRRKERFLSSDDDPCQRDSIIEELFYKTKELDNIRSNIDDVVVKESPTKQIEINNSKNFSNNRIDKQSDFQIYQILSQNCGSKENSADEMNGHGERYEGNANNYSNNWYQSISAIKIFLDMLWLNTSSQVRNRSRSQSSNCSSDREKFRRSFDSVSSFNNSLTSASASKPPTSHSFKWDPTSKYFLEFKFPSNSDQENHQTKRVYLKNDPTNTADYSDVNGVKSLPINHVSEFNVSIDEISAKKWWRGTLKFRLICQNSNYKENTVAVGILPLRNIISTNNLYRLLPIRLPRTNQSRARVVIGSLAMRTSMVINSALRQNVSKVDQHFTWPKAKQIHDNSTSKNKSFQTVHEQRIGHTSRTPRSSNKLTVSVPTTEVSKMVPISLESLLMASYVRYVNTKSNLTNSSEKRSCNLYLIGKLLWCQNQIKKSRILWGSSKIFDDYKQEQENFKFHEKLPLVLTSELLEKFKNNIVILEVWDKRSDGSKDILFGLIKISINNFYISFKNERIRQTVLNNVFPVISCDDWMNIEDPLTGKSKGQIHILLAIGLPQQIENLQMSKENTVGGQWNRNYLTYTSSSSELIEHSIEIDIECLKNVRTENLSDESFYYVQYYFPQQNSISDSSGKNWETAIYRSVSHPAQSDVEISDTNSHRYRLPLSNSLKSVLNKHFETYGKKHILFELYMKQYSPFPTSRPIAKGHLPIGFLYQLLNQHSVDFDSRIDTVTQQQVPVRLLSDEGSSSESDTIGILHIRLSYRTKLIQSIGKQHPMNSASQYDQPIVRIEILSATGLQNAAEALTESHPDLQYPAVTGVNSSVKFWITDESKKHCRNVVTSLGIQKFQVNQTKTIPHSFTPKFDHISESLLGPIIDKESASYQTLAEKILSGIFQLNVEVYHDVPKTIYCDFTDVASISKILLGKGRIALTDLLLRSSGFMGPMWVPIFTPMNLDSTYGGCKLNVPKRKNDLLCPIEKRKSVGAVEIRLGFCDKFDRNNILQLAMDSGFVIPWTNRLETEDLIWQTTDTHGCTFKYVTINVEEIELASNLITSVFAPEVGFSKSSIKILTRYRIYKYPISGSPCFTLTEDELSEKVYIPINFRKQYCYKISSDLFRYFRESKLEIQVWGIYGASKYVENVDDEPSENLNDIRLLGSATFDLSTLIMPSDQLQKSVSHILPIWKRGIANCGNSNITVSVDICGAASPLPDYCSDNDDDPYYSNKPKSENQACKISSAGAFISSHEKSFPVHVLIEKAVNIKLPLSKTQNYGSIKDISYFVSFPCDEHKKIVNSTILKGFKEVIWNFECDTRFSYSLLQSDNSTLDFKVFYSSSESEIEAEITDAKVMLGIVKIDLSLLLKGFERVIGWYNITDLQGDCCGQIKVGVSPTIPLVPNSAALAKHNFQQAIPNKMTYNRSNNAFTIEDHQEYLASVQMRLRGHLGLPNVTVVDTNEAISKPDDPNSQDLVSKSLLFSSLKEKMKELDNLNENLKQKINKNENIQIGLDTKVDHRNPVEFAFHEPIVKNTSSLDNWPMTQEEFDNYFGVLSTINNSIVFENPDENLQVEVDKEPRCTEEPGPKEYDGINYLNESDFPFYNEKENDEYLCFEKLDCLEPNNDKIETVDYSNFDVHSPRTDEDCLSVCSDMLSSEIKFKECDENSDASSSHFSESRNLKVLNEPEQFESKTSINPEIVDNHIHDSWDSSLDNLSSHLDETNQQKASSSVEKLSHRAGIIPKFFPPSLDFQERLKTLKKNIENCPNLQNSESDENNKRLLHSIENSANPPAAHKTVNITDDEAKRLFKIFGIRNT